MIDPRREPEPSFGPDEEGDVVPAEDGDSAAWVAPDPTEDRSGRSLMAEPSTRSC